MSKGFHKVKTVIDQAHRYGAQNATLQQEALQSSLGFLNTLDDTNHWFCNDDTRLVVVEAMSLFSFPDSDALNWLQTSIAKALGRCHQCAEKYQVAAKSDLRVIVTEVYGYTGENVSEFFHKIDSWDKQRLTSLFLHTVSAAQQAGKPLSDQSGPGFEAANLCGLFECLWCPSLCDDSSLMHNFLDVFIGIQQGGKLLRVPGSVLPAMYTFSFSGDRRLSEWARKCFEKTKHTVSLAQFRATGKVEVIKICDKLRRGLLHSTSFWNGLRSVLQYTDPVAVFEETRDADMNLMDFICGEISTPAKNLSAVVQCLRMLLSALGSNVWASCPMPAQEVGPRIILNPKFIELLAHPESLVSASSHKRGLTECLSWIEPYVLAQFGSNKYRTAAQISDFLNAVRNPTLPAISQLECKAQTVSMLKGLLRDLLLTSDKESKRTFQMELRALIDTKASMLSDIAFAKDYSGHDWASVRSNTVDVLLLTVQLDCDLLWLDYVSLSTTEFWGHKDNKYSVPNSTVIWAIISRNTNESNIDIIQRFIEVVGRNIPLIDTIDVQNRMSSGLKIAVETFNRTLNSAIALLNSAVRDIGGLWSCSQLTVFLSRPQTNEGIIALMFSPNHETFQEALNLLKEAYQGAGRIEALRSSFETSPASTIQGFIHVVNSWSVEGIFKSAVRVVRTASNILDILFSSRDGLITTEVLIALPETLFLQLWQGLWRMLETAYRMALPWADLFDKDDLIEFMRDVLECSNLLLENLPDFEKVITGTSANQNTVITPEKQRELDNALLNECLKAVKSLTTWLRLNNEDLLQACVNLVCDILQRLARADIRLSDETVFTFDRIILNSKRKKNCLNEAQRTEIYIALCDHTESPEAPSAEVNKPVPDQSHRLPNNERPSASVYDQMQLAAARRAVDQPEKQRLPNVSSKLPLRSMPVPPTRSMTPEARAEFLRKRTGELPKALQTRGPVARNASAGATRKEESSASESDSDDDIEGLFTSIGTKSPRKSKVEKRQTQKLEVGGVNLVRRDARSERNRIEQNLRARTNPDLTDLHMTVLAWDPAHSESFPPGCLKADYAKLTDVYQTADRYRRAVEPLFLLETWQHIVSSRENIKEKDKFEMVLQTRSAVDKFVDLIATMSQNDWKKQIITDPDLLMLSTTNNFSTSSTSEFCLAKVQSVHKKKDIVEIGLRTVPSAGMVKHLRPTVQLHAVKLSGLTPIHREYATLKALPYYDLCDEIVAGRPTRAGAVHQADVNKIMTAYGVNEPQAKAIDAAVHNTGFTLIQGPPGTGKTKTILGMVGAFLSQSRLQGNAIQIPGQRQVQKKEELRRKKILLCAPSNAAVDEIVLRLKNGIYTDKGERYTPKVVRMGMSDAININVQDVTLDALLDDMLNRADDKIRGGISNDPSELRDKLNETLKERDAQRTLLNKARAENQSTQAIEAEIKRLNNRKTHLGEQLDELRDKQSQKARAKDIERKKFQTLILAEADVICATLSGSGHDLMASIAVDFETVIIDEACQTTELSALIPLKYGCTRCVMVGDPNQLPPTVLSTEAVGFAYNESLFVRMQRNNPNAVRLLAIQYRMHSSISKFPSQQFYNGALLDGPEVDVYTKRAWHNSSIFGTYRFFDVRGREESNNSHSVYNLAEAKAALAIVKRLQEDFFDVDFDGRIGIVTPYKEQHNQIRRMFQQHFGQSVLSMIDFNTVDGFQGQEKDIIIFSCVRANENKGIGFLSDVRRMNVALTRAKCSVFILGHAGALKTNTTWNALVTDAQTRKLYTTVNSNTFSQKVRLEKSKAVEEQSSRPATETSKKEVLSKDSNAPKPKVNRPDSQDLKAPSASTSTAIFETFKKPSDHMKKVAEGKPVVGLAKEIRNTHANENGESARLCHVAVSAERINTANFNSGDKSCQSGTSVSDLPRPIEDRASMPQTQQITVPVKRKAEASLFIKRKKPTR